MSWWAPLERAVDPANSSDPLAPLPFGVGGEFEYGGELFNVHQTPGDPPLTPGGSGCEVSSGGCGGFTLPIASFLHHTSGFGISLALDPSDVTTLMRLHVSTTRAPATRGAERSQSFVFDRRLLSIGGNASSLNLAGDWLSHADCWRPALGWYVSRYPGEQQRRLLPFFHKHCPPLLSTSPHYSSAPHLAAPPLLT